jgi:SAM-dependent methyltransferase
MHDVSQKAAAELAFWRSRLNGQGTLTNDHYEHFYTTHFGWDQTFYRGKRILDIGCGPRGSLEWATGAGLRIGLDPLASAYRQLGAKRHSMYYVTGGAERLPFAAEAFDVVCAFNALDHVDDLTPVIGEIKRVLASQGAFLLISEIHRRPTVLEPSAYSWDIVARFQPELEIVEQSQVEYTVFSPEGFGDIYQSLRRGTPYNHGDVNERTGILSAKLRKRGPRQAADFGVPNLFGDFRDRDR